MLPVCWWLPLCISSLWLFSAWNIISHLDTSTWISCEQLRVTMSKSNSFPSHILQSEFPVTICQPASQDRILQSSLLYILSATKSCLVHLINIFLSSLPPVLLYYYIFSLVPHSFLLRLPQKALSSAYSLDHCHPCTKSIFSSAVRMVFFKCKSH